ncbi:Anthranilate 1,2-dioxygenase ferredoxin subunit [Planctomycetes bacterium Pla163]|uniref:Anthranilate 1,2-dioxygenase ferredoxin subunit n=1 Tax=Rohdeia mirabilis TaxID=2528008 RepID=A0A518CZY3_9BACT|nr:Anthranilate 1,2-dioxygenase ferredoxin subunit [Planctomycetes bacterium Pla163]
MGVGYRAVGWNRNKKRYDQVVLVGVLLSIAAFVVLSLVTDKGLTFETALIRSTAITAFLLLHVILCIGPLARLDQRFLPLLYNRRHLGVTMFAVAFVHGVFSLIQFHALGDTDPLVSLVTTPISGGAAGFPFQPLGAAALAILFLMAATSHDFWLANLTAPVWKALHMLVYAAYGLIVMHVALGALQDQRHPVLLAAVIVGLVLVLGLHLIAGFREKGSDREVAPSGTDDLTGWVDVGPADEIPDTRARILTVSGERVAVFRDGTRVFAMSNLCQHQNGPLGEGCVRDGLVTCPWHGYQYRPEDGQSPPPFHERVPTFATRVVDGRVWLDPEPRAAGTFVEPSTTTNP